MNNKTKKCIHEGCLLQPVFGKGGTNIGISCRSHASIGWVNVKRVECVNKDCSKIASFGKIGSVKNEFCGSHRPRDYVNIHGRKCEYLNCERDPSYGEKGSKKRKFCLDHAPTHYVNTNSKICTYDGCTLAPSYGIKGSKNREFCSSHAPIGYVSLNKKFCIFEGCTEIPKYGKKGSKKCDFCKTHALDNYVNNCCSTCQHETCELTSHYGIPGYSSEFCKTHKSYKMIRDPIRYTKDAIKACEYCSEEIHYSDDYCKYCKKFNELGKAVKSNKKELIIKSILEDNFSRDVFIHDRIVTGGCSKRRPDFLIMTEWGHIIIEVDEFQHKRVNYPQSCEINRMKEIYFDIGGSKLLFLRYNPDNYKCFNGCKPFSQSKRKYILIKTINEYINSTILQNLGIIYLFYDGFVTNSIKIEKIDPYKSY
jgi:hypothetical protein